MGLFDFFKSKRSNREVSLNPTMGSEDVDGQNQDNLEELSLPEKSLLKVSYATGWPIDIIYGYLNKNYEEKGYNDAIVKCDLTFRDMNKAIIKNKILMVFREVNLNYDVTMHDLETRIETCRAGGLITTVSDMENTMSLITTHKEELRTLELNFIKDVDASVPIQTYECGFTRGLACVALSTPINKAPKQQQNAGLSLTPNVKIA